MSELISFLTSKEIMVVYIVAIVACTLCFVIYLIDKNYYKRKQRHNTRELNKLVEEVNEVIEEEYEINQPEIIDTPILTPVMTTPVEEAIKVEEIKEDSITMEEEVEILDVENLILETMIEETKEEPVKVEEELTYTSVEPDVKQAQEELMRLTAELEKAEQETKNIDLTSYEEEQEENAIISLEELVRKSKEMYETNEITQYEDEGNEPISLEDLEKRMSKIKEETTSLENDTPVIIETIEEQKEEVVAITATTKEEPTNTQMVLDDFMTIGTQQNTTIEQKEPAVAYQTSKKFERSPIISPIYGIERKESVSDIELENTANYEKLDEEIKKTNEFLMTLRELQKNLD